MPDDSGAALSGERDVRRNGREPVGFARDKTEIAVGLLGLFSAEAVEMSPTFTVTESGAGSVDKSNGTKQKAVAETLEGASGFVPKSGQVALVAGHTQLRDRNRRDDQIDRARRKVKAKKMLLFKETAKVGKTKATV
jgi:hypothetical protein